MTDKIGAMSAATIKAAAPLKYPMPVIFPRIDIDALNLSIGDIFGTVGKLSALGAGKSRINTLTIRC